MSDNNESSSSDEEDEKKDENNEKIQNIIKIIDINKLPEYLQSLKISEDNHFIIVSFFDICKFKNTYRYNFIVDGPIKLKILVENIIKMCLKQTNNNIIDFLENFELVIDKLKMSYNSCPLCYKIYDEYVDTLTPCQDCLYSFMEFDFGNNIETEIINNGKVLELLIILTFSACIHEQRRDFIMNPFPEKYIFDGNKLYKNII